MEYKYSFEKLEVWNDARNLVKMIYLQTDNFPEKERFGLSSQMQRAAVSIVSNITEGVSRSSVKEKIRFLELAYGSLMETVLSVVCICRFGLFDTQYIYAHQSRNRQNSQ